MPSFALHSGVHVRSCLAALAAGAWLASACNEPSPPSTAPSSVEPSPNASIMPAPLASGLAVRTQRDAGVEDGGEAGAFDASSPPGTLREDRAPSHDLLSSRDGPGVRMTAHFHWVDVPVAAPVPELVGEAIRAARELTALELSIELSHTGRLRLRFESPAFPVPPGTELRARTEDYGHSLIWPDQSAYRILPVGALRALFSERRADVLPLLTPQVRTIGKGAKLGLETERLELKSGSGTLTLEQTDNLGPSPGGSLLCRLLAELVAAEPNNPACEAGLLPLRADYVWAQGGLLSFKVDKLDRQAELDPEELTLAPVRATLARGELPAHDGGLIDAKRLASFRSKAVPLEPPAAAPAEGLLVTNHGDLLTYLFVDGVTVAFVPPRSRKHVLGLRDGRYSVMLRDFFGQETLPAKPLDIPAHLTLGEPAKLPESDPSR